MASESAKNTAKAVAEDTIRMVNNYGVDMTTYGEVVLRSHRTLQQSWMRLACKVIKMIAEQEYYDDRNEASVLLAREMVKLDKFGYLPLV